jgi:hypothetical protein
LGIFVDFPIQRIRTLQTYKAVSLLKVHEMIKKNNKREDVGSTPWQWIIDYITKLANSHDPWYDLDSDQFGGTPSPPLFTQNSKPIKDNYLV